MTMAHAAKDQKDITYTQWDGTMMQMCVCAWGRHGGDCSLKMCPKGDDPMTINQNNKKIKLVLYADDNGATGLSGSIIVGFQGQEVAFAADATAAQCESTWESLDNVDDVTCTRALTGGGAYTAEYEVEFVAFPLFPSENNLHKHNGNPPIASFSCDTTNAAQVGTGLTGGVSCTFSDLVNSNIKEYQTCSGRGKCGANGVCECVEGFTGAACSDTATGLPDPGARNVLNIESTLSDFTATLLTLEAARAASSDFKILTASANDVELASIGGDGSSTLAADLTVGTGLTVTSGGLDVTGGATVQTGGLEVDDGGMTVGSGAVSLSNGVDLTMTDSLLHVKGQTDGILVDLVGASSTGTGLVLQQSGTSSNAYTFLEVKDQSDTTPRTIFSIHGGPGTEISRGGLTVVGGVTVSSGGLRVSAGGATVVGTLAVDGISSSGGITGTTASFSGSVTTTEVVQTSDRMLKENIQPIGNRSQALFDLEGVTYAFKARPESAATGAPAKEEDSQKWFGLIAQDVARHFPELVKRDSSGWLGVQYTGLTPVIIEVLKAQREEIQSLRRAQDSFDEVLERVKQLEAKVASCKLPLNPEI